MTQFNIQVSHVCEIFDIKSPTARNLTNLIKQINIERFEKDLRDFCREATLIITNIELAKIEYLFCHIRNIAYLCKLKMNTIAHTKQLTDRLSPYLFWDIDREQFDAERNSAHLIQRVLEYGEIDDWRTVRDYYGLDRIAHDCKTLRTLHPEALAFICLVTNTRKEDYRCYNFRQSFPTLWNS